MDVVKKATIKMRVYYNREVRQYKEKYKYFRSVKSNRYNDIRDLLMHETGLNRTIKALESLSKCTG